MLTVLALSTANAADTTTGTERQAAAVQRCLANWGEHPFGDTPEFEVVGTTVRVLARSPTQALDAPTAEPQLVYVEPNVTVLSKTVYQLRNPNGWYCFNNNVDVLGKVIFDAHCDAHITISREGAEVIAADTASKGGVTVLGAIRMQRSCGEPIIERPRHQGL